MEFSHVLFEEVEVSVVILISGLVSDVHLFGAAKKQKKLHEILPLQMGEKADSINLLLMFLQFIILVHLLQHLLARIFLIEIDLPDHGIRAFEGKGTPVC